MHVAVKKESDENVRINKKQVTALEVIAPQPVAAATVVPVPTVRERDERVLHDPLYPPYGRSDRASTDMYMRSNVIHSVPTRYPSNDTYRLVGYLVDEEDRNDVWKLFAREKHRGGRAEFYASPANKNMEMKVALDDKTVVGGGSVFRDLYNMPSEVRLTHPMFNQGGAYRVVELPRSDLDSGYI